MAVTPEQIENAERDLDVRTRQSSGARKAAAPTLGADEQLHALRQRIRAGLNEVGDDQKRKDAPSCRDCFQRGWIAAMQSLLKE